MSESNSESTPDYKLPKYTPRKLRLIRNWELGLSQEELAEAAQCDPRTVHRYENGKSPIPPGFIRKVEQLRVEERGKRARELGVDELDSSNVLIPSLELIELIPNAHVRKLAGKLVRTFVAVPKEWLDPDPDAEGNQPPPLPAPDPGPSPSGRRTHQAASETRTELRVIAAGMTGMVCLCGVMLGTMIVLRSELQAVFRSARSVRVARDAKVERPAPPPAAAREQPTPDAVDEQPDDASAEKEPLQVPGQVYTDKTKAKAKEEMGAEAKAKRSIKMRDKPYSWQRVAPCGPGEREKVGGCWLHIDDPPPCSEAAVESAGECYVPVPAKPTEPNTVIPAK